MYWTPSFNVLPLQTISTFVVSRNYVPRRFLFVWDSTTPLKVANKCIALILGEPSITSLQIWSAKALGGALPIFNSPFGKTISAKGGWDRVRTSYNCFVWWKWSLSYTAYLFLRNTGLQQTLGLVLSLSIGQQNECYDVRCAFFVLFSVTPNIFPFHFYIQWHHAQNV